MQSYLLPFILFLSFTCLVPVLGQPEPCGSNGDMTSFCNTACLICDIDGFEGKNDLQIQGQVMPEFCTTQYNNMSFIAFEAGTVDLTIEIEVYDCDTDLGMEVGFFESADCENFIPITACNTDIPANSSFVFSNTNPLTVGQYYFLIMDGSAGTRCNWKFNVLEGSTKPPALENSGTITGPDVICPDFDATFIGSVIPGAIFWRWTVNGVEQNDFSMETSINFSTEGEFEVCVQAANVCDQAPPTCKTVIVKEVEHQYFVEELCLSEYFVIGTDTIQESGFYEQIFILPNGCDSIVQAELTFLPQPISFVDINLCAGEAFYIGDNPYTETGIYIDSVGISLPCDSLINLDLFIIECEIIGDTDSKPVICNGESTGSLIFSIENGTPPFYYQWHHITDASINGDGTTNLLIDNEISGLPIGVYQIYILDEFGNDVVLFAEVVQPGPIQLTSLFSDFQGVEVSCFGGMDGSIDVLASGGVQDYSYFWSNNEVGPTIENLAAGDYQLTLVDAQGCERIYEFNLSEGDPIDLEANLYDPDCTGFDSGQIEIINTTGGLGPFLYSLDGSEYRETLLFENLEEGQYDVHIVDARGCYDTVNYVLTALEIPIIDLADDVSIELGEGIDIQAFINNIKLLEANWNPLEYLDCSTCLKTFAFPVNTDYYTISVSSEDGCTTTDSILIRVIKKRDVYVPNIFSPNNDGNNESFFISGGPELRAINRLRIYDRWGNLVFDGQDLVPGEASMGWNGQFKNKNASSGIYVWIADLEFIDDEIIPYNGSLSLIR